MNSIQNLFIQLSERYSKEPNLSDITWAMCQACAPFRRLFLHFFFEELCVDLVEDITREKNDENTNDSRVDLLIKVRDDKKPYLIEIKIGDKNHHFEQYTNAYKVSPQRLGYITNYPMNKNEKPLADLKGNPIGYQWREWKDFYEYLKEKNASLENQIDKSCIEGYMNYLKQVCGILTFEKPMIINAAYSIYELLTIVRNIINHDKDNYTIDNYNTPKCYDKDFVQQKLCFKVRFKNKGEEIEDKYFNDIYGWFSIYCDREYPEIYIYFTNEEKWGLTVYNLLDEERDLHDGEYFKKPYIDDKTFFFHFCDREHRGKNAEKFNSYFESLSLSEQRVLLEKFVDGVLQYIYNLIMHKAKGNTCND